MTDLIARAKEYLAQSGDGGDNARKLIEELMEKFEDYEDRIEELTNAVDYFTGDTRQGIYTAIGIMTQDKEGIDVHKRLANR